jgi:hypothetical protein
MVGLSPPREVEPATWHDAGCFVTMRVWKQ